MLLRKENEGKDEVMMDKEKKTLEAMVKRLEAIEST